MRRILWSVLLGAALLTTSFVLYIVHFMVFRDMEFITMRGLAHLAFVPIQGLVVTLIIAELLVVMQKKSRLEKMRMVIGVFFSEMGTALLDRLSDSDRNASALEGAVEHIEDWSRVKVPVIMASLPEDCCEVDLSREELVQLREEMVEERNFMARLLENPNLLDDERFTEMLWAVFHLTEELDARKNMLTVPDSDLEHLNIDVNRVYELLLREWLHYMKHLNSSYPFLFAFALRTSPLHPAAEVEVR
jgi:hypothetical protein